VPRPTIFDLLKKSLDFMVACSEDGCNPNIVRAKCSKIW